MPLEPNDNRYFVLAKEAVSAAKYEIQLIKSQNTKIRELKMRNVSFFWFLLLILCLIF